MTVLIPQILEYSYRDQYSYPFPSKINSKGNVSIYLKNGNDLQIVDAESVFVNKSTYTIIKKEKVISIPIDSVLDVEIDSFNPIILDSEKYTKYPYRIVSTH